MNDIIENRQFHIDLGSIVSEIKAEPVWCDCVFCNLYVETKYTILQGGVCGNCREKLLNRIKLIMNFQ